MNRVKASFGLVKYDSLEEMQKDIARGNMRVLDGRKIVVNRAFNGGKENGRNRGGMCCFATRGKGCLNGHIRKPWLMQEVIGLRRRIVGTAMRVE
ncbi:hypothetical protein QQP08_021781 [Theobroma cacao]|uniref:RRM domain-containing protein n=1 Tax=Theobroma cacao TaxID=3641 RepID=A0A061F9P6_THECC|nr:Uncharacterized protein TCM_032019 [Theobroma cacao]WRX29294.1 hypothetical protein QQP08_021781 [Theobroma cacao]